MKIIEERYAWNGGLVYVTAAQKDRIILHHAASASCTAQDIHRWHIANGWTGIGYHYFVRKDGSIYRGRPELTVGAHTEGYNTSGIGICCEGDYSKEQQMSAAQKRSLAQLVCDIQQRLGITLIQRHCDLNATECPGLFFPLAEIMTLIHAKNPARSERACSVRVQMLQEGEASGAVKALQELLIGSGYDCGACGADGIFGADTARAVKVYQQQRKLAPDGIVGEKTWTCLLGAG